VTSPPGEPDTSESLPPWQVALRVVLYRCLRCGAVWLPGYWWRKDAAKLPLPAQCVNKACRSWLWNRASQVQERPSRQELAAAEAILRRREKQ
jgi:hypothetical protein